MSDKKRVGAKLRRASTESSLADDIKAIGKHFGIASREAEAKHGGKTVDEAVEAAPQGRVLKKSGYDASSGRVEHAQNVAQSASSPGGSTITAEEREHIRAIAKAVIKAGGK